MTEPTPITIPLENVNDDTVKLTAWLVEDGQEVREGQPLAEIETSKALFEMSASTSGRVRLQARAGDELAVGAIIGYIGADASFALPENAPAAVESAPSTEGVRFSKKAQQLLNEHKIDAAVFQGRGMVRESDVLDYLQEKQRSGRDVSGLHVGLRDIPISGVTLPAIFHEKDRGRVDPAFLAEIRAGRDVFARLSSEEKCRKYREHGAEIGEGTTLGANTVILAPRIVLGPRVRIAENSSIDCRERFAAGQYTTFQGGLTVKGGTVAIGENVYAGARIQIGGGGHGDPWSLLCVGDSSFLGDDLFINICRPVLIGKEVFLTQRSILVTHNVGHSVLEGYENRFAPIVLEDYSQIGMNSTVYAGTVVGRGAIVASNSYVISSIPAGKLAMGVPAKAVRDAARTLSRERQLQIAEGMVQQYRELLEFKGHSVETFGSNPAGGFAVSSGSDRFQLIFTPVYSPDAVQFGAAAETVIWTLEAGGATAPVNAALIDLLAKTLSGSGGKFLNTTREFLRKRGIRLQPGPWRYEGGLI